MSTSIDLSEKLIPNKGLRGSNDSSWTNKTEDNSSTNGRVFLLTSSAISWVSKKKTCITCTTVKSEFVTLGVAGKEVEWFRNMILKISLWTKPITLTLIRCDSDATLAMAYSQMYNGNSRHLGVRNSMIRELIMNG
ncbi:hypothetical protein Tco_0217424 [Tanacetum coccineum]